MPGGKQGGRRGDGASLKTVARMQLVESGAICSTPWISLRFIQATISVARMQLAESGMNCCTPWITLRFIQATISGGPLDKNATRNLVSNLATASERELLAQFVVGAVEEVLLVHWLLGTSFRHQPQV